MRARDVNPYDLSSIAQAERERKPLSHRQALAEFRVAKYDELLARAEAAEQQLAEARERIAGLEKLVPDVDVLEEVAEFANSCNSESDYYQPELARHIDTMLALVDDMREYKEATDAKD